MSSVSAIVSAYFCEPWLAGRIENLLEQTPQPEVIVVCQRGSADERIAQQYAVKLVLTEYVPTVYAAWNLGLAQAQGAYLTNANADDRLYPGALQALAAALDDHPSAAVAYGNVDKVIYHDQPAVGEFDWASGGLARLQQGCFLGPMPMWRRELHQQYGPFDAEMESAGDYEFWLRLAYYGESFIKVGRQTGAYMIREDSAERRNPWVSNWETARARSRYSLKKWWAALKDRHKGQRAFILGNGPGLNDIDLDRLKGEITFGSNRLYLSGFTPTYHLTCNPLVLEQFGEEIARLNCTLFRSGFELDTSETAPGFYEPYEPMWEGYTVTYVALQVAHYMGIQEAILVGVDHDYGQIPGRPNQDIEGQDQGHFHRDYFRGARWHLPDLARSEMAYQLAREVYQASGRRIVNASTRTKLTVFPRTKLEAVL